MPQPLERPVVFYPSPILLDKLLVEHVDANKPDYKPLQPGDRHPKKDEFPGFVLVQQKPIFEDKFVERVFVNDRSAQNTYNASTSYAGDSNSNPVYVRHYIERRLGYAALAKGSTLTGVLGVKVTAGGTGYPANTTLSFSGGGGSGAAGTPIIFRGAVVGVVMTAEGTGYTSAPTPVFTGSGGSGASGTAYIQGATAVLTSEKADPAPDPLGSLYLAVTRVYEVLPGPYIPFTRYDDFLGPIQGRRRAVVNTGQAATLTATGKKTYEGRDGSSYVSWELEESWTDGVSTAFPVVFRDFYDEERGAVQQRIQLVAATGTEVGSLSVSGGTVTQITYEPYNEFLLKKITETWAVPGPLLRNPDRYDESLGKISSTRQLVENTNQSPSYGSSSRTTYQTSPYGQAVLRKIVESWDAENFPLNDRDTYDVLRGAVQERAQVVARTGSEVGSLSVVGGAVTEIVYEPINEYLARKITRTWLVEGPFLDEDKYDVLRGAVQQRTQLVARTGTEVGSLSVSGGTATEISYEPENEAVLRRIVRTYAIPGPTLDEDQYDDRLGAVQVRTQLVAGTGSEAATKTAGSGTITETDYEPFGGASSPILKKIIKTYAETGPARTSYKLSPSGNLEKTTQQTVPATTLPAGGAHILLDDVQALNAVHAERTLTTLVQANGSALTTDSGYKVGDIDEETGTTIWTTIRERALNTTLPAMGQTFETGSVLHSWEKTGESTDRIYQFIQWADLPQPRLQFIERGFQFPAIFKAGTFSVANLQEYLGAFPPPWPGNGTDANTYYFEPHRQLTRPCRAAMTYSLGPPAVTPRQFSVTSPGAGSRLYPIITQNTIHPAIVVDETIEDPPSTFTTYHVENIPASTPSTYEKQDVLVISCSAKPWRGNIWRTIVVECSEELAPSEFEPFLATFAFRATTQNPIIGLPRENSEYLYMKSTADDEGDVVVYGRGGGVFRKERVHLGGVDMVHTTKKFNKVRHFKTIDPHDGDITLYGSGTAAHGSITFDDQPSIGDTVNLGLTGFDITYEFTDDVSTDPNTVLIGATKEDTAENLRLTINDEGVEGTNYGPGTTIHPDIEASIDPSDLFGTNFVFLKDKRPFYEFENDDTWVLTTTAAELTLDSIGDSKDGAVIAFIDEEDTDAFNDFVLSNPALLYGRTDLAFYNLPAGLNMTSDAVALPDVHLYLVLSAADNPPLAVSYEVSNDGASWSAGATTLPSIGNGAVHRVELSESTIKYIRLKIDNTGGNNRAVHAVAAYVVNQ